MLVFFTGGKSVAISVDWDNDEKNAIRYEFSEKWTWSEFFAALDQDDEMIASVPHTVHLILDFRQARVVPPNPGAQFRSVAQQVSDQLGMIIVVGTNMWFEMVVQMFVKLYGSSVKGITGLKTVKTLDEAHTAIANYSPLSSGR